MSEVVAFIETSFGARAGASNVTEVREQIGQIAGGVIGDVSSILSELQGTGSSNLASAVSAIGSLGSFRPTQVNVTYQPPAFIKAQFVVPSALNPTSVNTNVTQPPLSTFTWSITGLDATAETTDAPTLGNITIPDAPPLQNVGGAPLAPQTTELSVPEAPEAGSLGELVLPQLAVPTLQELNVPTFELPTLPEFALPEGSALPDAPLVTVGYDQRTYTPTVRISDNPQLFAVGADTIGEKLIAREIRSAIEAFKSRNLDLPDEVWQNQTDLAVERGAFLNNAELRRRAIDQTNWNTEMARAILAALVQADGQMFEANMALARAAFEAEVLRAGVQVDIAKALTSLYNARIEEFKIEAEMYRVQLEAKLAELDKWKAAVDAEVAKTQLNAQLGRNYAAQVRAITTQAELFASQVQALFANVEMYRARASAVTAQAELARTNVQVYSGKVDAYVADLSAYKAQFQAYAAKIQATSAKNQLETTKTAISMTDMQVAGQKINEEMTKVELDAERLKLQAQQLSSSFEPERLNNTLESLKAQIQADDAKRLIADWTANVQIQDARNDAIADNAQAAARYYSQASDSAYRAAEQSMRAVMSSSQAAMVAQEAAGRTAAAVAQGAYSAVHVSARLHGSGSVSSQQEANARIQVDFSDMMTYEEKRIQSLSA